MRRIEHVDICFYFKTKKNSSSFVLFFLLLLSSRPSLLQLLVLNSPQQKDDLMTVWKRWRDTNIEEKKSCNKPQASRQGTFKCVYLSFFNPTLSNDSNPSRILYVLFFCLLSGTQPPHPFSSRFFSHSSFPPFPIFHSLLPQTPSSSQKTVGLYTTTPGT